MYQAHVERLRTTAAFIKIFIYRPPVLHGKHQSVATTAEDRLSGRDGQMVSRAAPLPAQDDPARRLHRLWIGHVLPIESMRPSVDTVDLHHFETHGCIARSQLSCNLEEAQELLVLAYDLLRQLSTRFSASHRQLQIMQSAFRRLDLSLKKRHHKSGRRQVRTRVQRTRTAAQTIRHSWRRSSNLREGNDKRP